MKDAALDALKRYFGHTAFREGQRPLTDALLAGQDVLGVMPTGAGKSVCYQVPATVLPGLTLVISPLISLMQDQVTALVQTGVPAAESMCFSILLPPGDKFGQIFSLFAAQGIALSGISQSDHQPDRVGKTADFPDFSVIQPS